MKSTQPYIKIGLLGVVIGGLAVWLITSMASNTNKTNTSAPITQQYSSDTLDAHFIEQMIPHHEDAITMAKLAQSNAQTPEVKQLAQNIINSQSKENDQMRAWYKAWFGRELPTGEEVMQHHGMGSRTGMHMGIRGDASDIARLTEAENFDVAFVEHMIPHHQMAVMMASMLKNGTQRTEMKKLADDIVTAQTSEIEQMRKWLQNWND